MGRIRTYKPEFLQHEGLYDLECESGLPVRLAYMGLWSQCDREGRFKWQPRTLKAQVMPHDELDFSRVLDALTTRGFVVKYASRGEFFGCVPTFTTHQVINNRESASVLPAPDASDCDVVTSTRDPRVPDACPTEIQSRQGEGKGREGKGREGKGREGKGREGNKERNSTRGARVGDVSGTREDNLLPGIDFDSTRGYSDSVKQVFDHYRTHHPRAFLTPQPKSKEWGLIAARLKEGYTVDDLCVAIDGNHKSPHHCGQNDTGTKYHDLELIVRNGSKVAGFIEKEKEAESPVLSEKTRRSIAAAESWCKRRKEARDEPL